MLSREERIFSELLLARGLVAREFIEGFAKKKSSGPSEPSLAEFLVDSGGLAKEQAEEALAEARAIDATLAPHLEGGSRLGEFLLIRELGRGGMGIVYEAEQESLGRRVALKVLPAGAALDERLAIRFLREARAAGRLQHPGIVSVFASGRADGVLYFAMELIEGRSLAEVVAEGPMAPESAARVVAEVARALDHAHRADLVHRDVKPENVLIAADGRARLTDFGLVHESVASSFTLPHHVLGTPSYMAPEQALGSTVDLRSDIYSLGAVLYTLLCGKPPYGGVLPSVVLSRVLEGPPPPLLTMKDGVPRSLAAICDRAMARKPEDRYATAAELAEDLEAFGRGEAPAAVVLPVRSRRVAWLVGTTAIVAVGALLAAISMRGSSTVPDATKPGGTVERTTIFGASTSPPPNTYDPDPTPSELGVKFRSDVTGYVTGVRFFKDRRNNGAHVGHLWTRAGALLATATFSDETAEGWQEARFAGPVPIEANTTYVASYHVNADEGYNQELHAFLNSGVDHPPLHALHDGVDGCNAVFIYGPPRDLGGFPSRCARGSNYFVDVVFQTGGDAAAPNAPPGARIGSTTIFDASTSPPSDTYQGISFQAEIGMKFRSDACGYVTGIRFFKDRRNDGAHVGHLWTGAGALLATAVFSGETSEGWQEAEFTSPIRVAPHTTYVASYHVGAGKGFNQQPSALKAAGVDRPPLHALQTGVDGCNGLFKYGPPRDTGGFPDECASDSNVFVDVAFREIECASNADPTFVFVNGGSGGKTWPTLSPDGKLMAYATCAGGRCDTSLQDLSTGDIVKLAAGRSGPAFAPDGRRIAFGTDAGVDVLDFDGRTIDERSVRHLDAPFACARPAWSGNGAELVFSARDDATAGSSKRGIWVGDPTSRRVRMLTRLDARALAYSPHGTRIAFVSRTGAAAHVWTIRPDGGGATRLTSDAAAEWSPFWSADGRSVYFGSDRDGTPQLWSIDVDEASGRPAGSAKPALNVVFPATFYATLSADGQKMAIVCEPDEGRIVRIPFDPDAGALAAPPAALPRYPSGAVAPQLSPDQTLLVYTASLPSNDLAIVAADGSGEPRLLTTGAFADGAPRWSPDGTHIAFHSNRSGRNEIWLVRRDGSDLRQVTKTTETAAGYPVWSPDGTRLAYSVDRRGGSVIAVPTGALDTTAEPLPSYGPQQVFEPWSWSPDGNALAGSVEDVGVILYSIADRTYRRITDFGGHPVWLADGRHMMFVGSRKIFMVDSDGGGLREIYAAAPASLRPFLSVSADGRSIFTSLGATDESIWTTNLLR